MSQAAQGAKGEYWIWSKTQPWSGFFRMNGFVLNFGPKTRKHPFLTILEVKIKFYSNVTTLLVTFQHYVLPGDIPMLYPF